MDTTGVTTGMTFYKMCQEANVYKKVEEELAKIIENDPEKVSHETIQKMDYVGALVKEVFRFFVPVPVLVPKFVMEDNYIGP